MLRERLIKLAYERKDLRSHLLPLLKEAGNRELKKIEEDAQRHLRSRKTYQRISDEAKSLALGSSSHYHVAMGSFDPEIVAAFVDLQDKVLAYTKSGYQSELFLNMSKELSSQSEDLLDKQASLLTDLQKKGRHLKRLLIKNNLI